MELDLDDLDVDDLELDEDELQPKQEEQQVPQPEQEERQEPEEPQQPDSGEEQEEEESPAQEEVQQLGQLLQEQEELVKQEDAQPELEELQQPNVDEEQEEESPAQDEVQSKQVERQEPEVPQEQQELLKQVDPQFVHGELQQHDIDEEQEQEQEEAPQEEAPLKQEGPQQPEQPQRPEQQPQHPEQHEPQPEQQLQEEPQPPQPTQPQPPQQPPRSSLRTQGRRGLRVKAVDTSDTQPPPMIPAPPPSSTLPPGPPDIDRTTSNPLPAGRPHPEPAPQASRLSIISTTSSTTSQPATTNWTTLLREMAATREAEAEETRYLNERRERRMTNPDMPLTPGIDAQADEEMDPEFLERARRFRFLFNTVSMWAGGSDSPAPAAASPRAESPPPVTPSPNTKRKTRRQTDPLSDRNKQLVYTRIAEAARERLENEPTPSSPPQRHGPPGLLHRLPSSFTSKKKILLQHAVFSAWHDWAQRRRGRRFDILRFRARVRAYRGTWIHDKMRRWYRRTNFRDLHRGEGLPYHAGIKAHLVAQKKRAATELPHHLLVETWREALPIVERVAKAYKKQLGSKNRLTQHASKAVAKLRSKIQADDDLL